MGWWGVIEDGKEIGVSGDVPSDIMGSALNDIIMKYRSDWLRLPSKAQLQAAFDFTVNTALEMAQEEWKGK